jgi:zinc transporter
MRDMSRRLPIELADSRGLICAFHLHPEQPAQSLEWPAAIAAFDAHEPVWLHFNQNDSRARNWITNNENIPQSASDLLLAQTPRIQQKLVNSDGLVVVIGDLHYDFDTDPDGLGVLCLYINSHCIISTRRRPLKAIDQVRQDLDNGRVIATPIQLLVHLIKILVDIFSATTDDSSDDVDRIEDLVFKGRFQNQRGELGRLRRLLARLHRYLRANRQALLHLITSLRSWCSQGDEALLRQNLEKFDECLQDLELVQERARLLQEEMAGRLEEAVNRNLYVLSVVTTIFLPITLITGIFGMNVGGLPWTETTIGFGAVVWLMLFTLTVTIVILRRQRFL